MTTLLDRFDGIVCDLDGVVYRGHEAVPHAAESLVTALSHSVRVVYATNNASRTPGEVAAHLDALGLPGPESRVVTSAQAGAHYLAQRCPAGSRVLAVGGPGVWLALQEAGLTPVSTQTETGRVGTDQPVSAVLQGYGAAVGWADLAEAGYAVQAGALWVATNQDRTLPTDRGIAPGNGTLVAAVREVVNVDPVVVGKPHTPLYELSVSVLGTKLDRTLAIGDRLDTDIMGATSAGMQSLFVFGGVHGWADLVGAQPLSRPTFTATDLRSLHLPYTEPIQDVSDSSRWVCGQAQCRLSAAGDLMVSRTGTLNDRVRAALAAVWQAVDQGDRPVEPFSGDGAGLAGEIEKATSDR
jgi:glycerol 3-phosphatase-2